MRIETPKGGWGQYPVSYECGGNMFLVMIWARSFDEAIVNLTKMRVGNASSE